MGIHRVKEGPGGSPSWAGCRRYRAALESRRQPGAAPALPLRVSGRRGPLRWGARHPMDRSPGGRADPGGELRREEQGDPPLGLWRAPDQGRHRRCGPGRRGGAPRHRHRGPGPAGPRPPQPRRRDGEPRSRRAAPPRAGRAARPRAARDPGGGDAAPRRLARHARRAAALVDPGGSGRCSSRRRGSPWIGPKPGPTRWGLGVAGPGRRFEAEQGAVRRRGQPGARTHRGLRSGRAGAVPPATTRSRACFAIGWSAPLGRAEYRRGARPHGRS